MGGMGMKGVKLIRINGVWYIKTPSKVFAHKDLDKLIRYFSKTQEYNLYFR
jgi:hypothetical protein